MKTRSLVELFILIKSHKKFFKIHHCAGICHMTSIMWYLDIIGKREYIKLKNYIENNRPQINSKYYDVFMRSSGHYWSLYDWHPRVLWINAQIKLLTKK